MRIRDHHRSPTKPHRKPQAGPVFANRPMEAGQICLLCIGTVYYQKQLGQHSHLGSRLTVSILIPSLVCPHPSIIRVLSTAAVADPTAVTVWSGFRTEGDGGDFRQPNVRKGCTETTNVRSGIKDIRCRAPISYSQLNISPSLARRLQMSNLDPSISRSSDKCRRRAEVSSFPSSTGRCKCINFTSRNSGQRELAWSFG